MSGDVSNHLEFITTQGAWRMIVVPDTFDGLVNAVRFMLDEHYPADVFTGESGDPGPVFVAAIYDALAALEGGGS